MWQRILSSPVQIQRTRLMSRSSKATAPASSSTCQHCRIDDVGKDIQRPSYIVSSKLKPGLQDMVIRTYQNHPSRIPMTALWHNNNNNNNGHAQYISILSRIAIGALAHTLPGCSPSPPGSVASTLIADVRTSKTIREYCLMHDYN